MNKKQNSGNAHAYFSVAMTVAPKTFANNFWGKDDAGYEVLTHKMNMARKTCEDLKAMYAAKSALHEELGKKIKKQIRSELGREETGTLRDLLDAVHKELEITAQNHFELAQKIKMNLELSLDNFILELKDRRKLMQTNVDKAHRNKQLYTSHVARAKEKYEAECAKQANLENQLQTSAGREADRIRQKLDRCQIEIKTLEKEYRNACSKAAEATAVWNHEWKIACDKFQEMEEKRMDFIHHSLCIYVNILSTATGQDQESYERFWKSLDRCDPKADLQRFIDEKGTGPLIPEPPMYVDYFDDPTKTLPTFQVANFAENESSKSSSSTKTAIFASTSDHQSSAIKQPTKSSSTATTCQRSSTAMSDLTQRPIAMHTSVTNNTLKSKPLPPERNADEDKLVEKFRERRVNLYSKPDISKIKKPAPANSANAVEKLPGVDDEAIDPRAKVMFSVGGNIFPVDHAEHQDSVQRRVSKRLGSRRKMDEDLNTSIRGLLQELGVVDNAGSGYQSLARQTSLNRRGSSRRSTASGNSGVPISKMHLKEPVLAWARAVYDYQGTEPDDLAFSRGTWLAIVNMEHEDWWLAQKWDERTNSLSSVTGYVPHNFVQIFE
ncbi:hypothetical protein VTP01DRAFT_4770 [Rhizomucor pusillus]|uniref:uncharacterized protein n=1 Tax=Rhizomucor pusillus TaxID=4840 RepID=UPI003743AAD0